MLIAKSFRCVSALSCRIGGVRSRVAQSQILWVCAACEKGVEAVTIMDMGQHAIKDWPEPQLLLQVLVPGLEDRARLASDLNTFEQITTGGRQPPSHHPDTAWSSWIPACCKKLSCKLPGREVS